MSGLIPALSDPVFAVLNDAVFVVDDVGLIRESSDVADRMFGYERGQLLGCSIEMLVPANLRDAHERHRHDYSVDPSVRAMSSRAPLTAVRSDGTTFHADISLSPLPSADGMLTVAVVRNIDMQVRAHLALASSEQLLRLAIDGAPQGMAIVGLDLTFWQVNPALCALLGLDEKWLLSHTVRDVIDPQELDTDLAGWDEVLDGTVQAQTQERSWRRADDSTVPVMVSLALVRDEEQQPLFYVAHVMDNTEAHRIREELAHRASHDALTGLTNRDQLEERIARVLNRQKRRGGETGFLFCDLDLFKQINDTYGHAVGDEVLRITAQRIASVVRSEDIVTRLGGDEFGVVLSTVYDMDAAVAVAQKIRKAVGQPLALATGNVGITTSVGVALAGPGIDANKLLRNADLALYDAKHSGRNQIRVAGDDSTSGVENSIREGLAHRQFTAWFQPIVILNGGALAGYEALARRVRPDGDVVEPDDFLSVARRTTLVTEVDLVVLADSTAALQTLPEHQHVGVNISMTTLTNPHYAELAAKALMRSNLDPARLHLEISENLVQNITEGAGELMHDLARTGIRWYIDNFGTGNSSISQLRDLPIAGLKLDGSITANLGSSHNSYTRLAQALAGLADGLGLDTVATGIETVEQAAILTAQGWQHGQGWLYGRAEPLATVP